MQNNDTHLIQAILKGDKQAERMLYERYERYWFRLSLRYGKDRMEAQDIMQEGLIGIYKDLKQFDPERGKFGTWSGRVLVNAALRYLKKNHWQQSFTELDEAAGVVDESIDITSSISAKELIEVIQQLPMGYRIVFNMFVMEGYSHKEIAKQLDIKVGTSKSQLSKAKSTLKKQIELLYK